MIDFFPVFELYGISRSTLDNLLGVLRFLHIYGVFVSKNLRHINNVIIFGFIVYPPFDHIAYGFVVR